MSRHHYIGQILQTPRTIFGVAWYNIWITLLKRPNGIKMLCSWHPLKVCGLWTCPAMPLWAAYTCETLGPFSYNLYYDTSNTLDLDLDYLWNQEQVRFPRSSIVQQPLWVPDLSNYVSMDWADPCLTICTTMLLIPQTVISTTHAMENYRLISWTNLRPPIV